MPKEKQPEIQSEIENPSDYLPAPPDGPRLAQPIIPILGQLHDGRLFDQMGAELARLVTDVVHSESGKGAKLTLELSIDKPNPKLHLTGREILITAQIKSKSPDDPPDAHIFYFDEDGGLHMNDPYQRRMFEPVAKKE